ncbi:S41 family peptidase [Roseateles sp.]|uniref:S41 family peptidase n=1 Tax=Roseateles sp. TaxID=1971397 RepID=UPI003BA8F26A
MAQASASTTSATPGFFRQAALHGEQIFFVAEGDIWRVPTLGGTAERLTTHTGAETLPAVSPGGEWLAFVAQYDGPADLYLMPVKGGVPQRLTWEGVNQKVWGFSAQGELLFTAPAQDGRPITQLYGLNPKTGIRRVLPVGQASDGALSADGNQLYFTRNGLRGDNAKQYRGGAIARLWTLDLTTQSEARPLLAEGANDSRPMPYRNAQGESRVAFLSDRDGSVNLWSVNTKGQDLRQHSRFKGWDIRHASIHARQVSVTVGADIHVLDLDAPGITEGRKLSIQLKGDFAQQRERWIKKPQDFLTHTALAPNGERVLLNSRGRLATQGVGALRRAELPQSQEGRCLKGEFSADSQQVFALCDFSGEREIWRFAANGLSPAQQLTRGATAMRTQLHPSPDGRHIAHADKEGHLYLTELKSGATQLIAHDKRAASIGPVSWSADSQTLAYTQPLHNGNREQILLYSLKDGKTHTVSSDRYDSESPVFSPDGRWLYFISKRSFEVTGNSSPWGDRNMGPFFDRRAKVYALALQSGLRFPFAAKDELSPAENSGEGKGDGKGEGKPEDKNESKPALKGDKKAEPASGNKPAIVWAGLSERLFEVPLPSGNYSALQVDAKRLWMLDTEASGERKSSLKTLSIDRQGGKAETVAEDVKSFALSADGKKLMIVRNATTPAAAPDILLIDAGPKLPAELGKFQVKWNDWQIATDPRMEWRQMFTDAWRMQRDYFYDRGMHGVDWAAMRSKYEPLVARLTDRAELAELMAQMVSELSVLHSQVGPGDVRAAPEEPGLAGLGARLSRQAQGWRIDQIYRSDPELPNELSPLAAPGLSVKVGDIITAVNGRPALQAADLADLLRGQAGKQVLLQLSTAEGREIQQIVTPVAQRREQQLRFGDWRYSRARAVEKASDGRIGYLHLRAMGKDDIADFAREFYAQSDREGLIIDVRFNGGGSIDSWILEKLMRRAWAFWQRRSPAGAPTYPNMQEAFRGHLVVLANEETYSDGETFTEGVKRLGVGPVIGKTTSGAGVWLSDQNRLVDNGIMRAAETGQMSADGQFLIEGIGVKPDIEVDNPPRATHLGGDAQLDAAIEVLKKAIRDQPVRAVKPGPYPRPLKL